MRVEMCECVAWRRDETREGYDCNKKVSIVLVLGEMGIGVGL